ncbi:MAG: DUF4180 domain-containing protein [Weeksellaceae bacterium]
MTTETLTLNTRSVTHIQSDDILIRTSQDALDLMASHPTDYLILHAHNFELDFWDLSTRKLGEVLQKFTNYQVKLAVIGDFDKYSKTFKQFIGESNRHGDYLFVSNLEEVKKIWQD